MYNIPPHNHMDSPKRRYYGSMAARRGGDAVNRGPKRADRSPLESALPADDQLLHARRLRLIVNCGCALSPLPTPILEGLHRVLPGDGHVVNPHAGDIGNVEIHLQTASAALRSALLGRGLPLGMYRR